MIWLALAAHLVLYVAVGLALVRFGRRFLPNPYNERSVMVAIVIAFGMLLALATLPHWHLMQN